MRYLFTRAASWRLRRKLLPGSEKMSIGQRVVKLTGLLVLLALYGGFVGSVSYYETSLVGDVEVIAKAR